MKEDFVSFETSKLLKEKGFDWDCIMVYDLERPKSCADGKLYDNFDNKNPNRFPDLCSAPSLALAMKWLREVHKIIITIDYNDDSDCEDNERYGFSVYYPSRKVDLATYVTYEEACEAAIKYCLENLI